MATENTPHIAKFDDIRGGIDQTAKVPFGLAFSVGTVTAIVYTPGKVDHQEPHDQDEIYIVISGTADFEVNDARHSLTVGDAAYVPAKAPHKFIDASEDFSCWAIFANSGLRAQS
jgi:mannose-6-phosphate isomerase-like protein (cupin superfamily)